MTDLEIDPGTDPKQAAVAVATACRILAHQGLAADVLGHVSVRLDAERILLRCRGPHDRGLLFTEVDDICVVRLDGGAELPDGYTAPNEMHIHTEIFRARPDVRAVVHVHPREVMVADLAEATLAPVFGAYNIPAARLALTGVPVYPRSVLIRTPELGADVAATMGDADVCILRGHGIATAGESVGQATMRALDLTELARVTGEIIRLGAEPRPVPDAAELPDLGAAFNDQSRWLHYAGRLALAGLAP